MEKFRVKPIVVEAIQYTGDLKPIKKFLGIKDAQYDTETRQFIYNDLNKDSRVIDIGDWVTKDVDGMISIWSNEAFLYGFEKIEE